jgi:hypothetical protein
MFYAEIRKECGAKKRCETERKEGDSESWHHAAIIIAIGIFIFFLYFNPLGLVSP